MSVVTSGFGNRCADSSTKEIATMSEIDQTHEEFSSGRKSRCPSYFLRAASWGDGEVVEELIKAGSDVREIDEKGETALHKSTRFSQLKVATLLLEKGCDVNARDNLGMTPLHWAAMCADTALTRLLLMHDADVFARDYYAGGITPLGIAQLMGAIGVQEMLERHVESGGFKKAL